MEDIKLQNKTSLGLPENIESALCYALTFVGGVVLYVLEGDNNKTIKFHALQSMLVFIPLFVIMEILNIMSYYMWYIVASIRGLVSLLIFITWLVLTLKAYKGQIYKVPIVGDIAAQKAGI